MRTPGWILSALALLGAGCGGGGGETGLHVIAQWSDVSVDQLEYVVFNGDGTLVHAGQRLPATAAGALSSGADAVIVLGAGMEGKRVRCQVTGFLAGTAVRRGEAGADLPASALAEIRITLAAVVAPGSDGGVGGVDGGQKMDGGAADAPPKNPVDGPPDARLVDAPGAVTPDAPPALGDNGRACTGAGECRSGFCAEGVCCDTACLGACQTCGRAGRIGTCSIAAAGTRDGRCPTEQPGSCGYDGTCAASGACQRYQPGTSCGQAVCAGNVLDGASTCDGSGTCAAGTPRSCAPYICDPEARACKTVCTANADCVPPRTCAGGQCGTFRALGLACANGVDCASGNCVDGVCCSSASCEVCFACDVSGFAGSCRPTPGGRPDPHGRCPTQPAATCGLNGTCNGQGACASYPDGTSCRMSRICLAGTCR
jgi:hypothetical protein